MPCGTAIFVLFHADKVHFNHCASINVDCIKLIKLLLCESVTANVFSPSACRLIQSLPRTRVEKHWDMAITKLDSNTFENFLYGHAVKRLFFMSKFYSKGDYKATLLRNLQKLVSLRKTAEASTEKTYLCQIRMHPLRASQGKNSTASFHFFKIIWRENTFQMFKHPNRDLTTIAMAKQNETNFTATVFSVLYC